uniref:Heparanase-like protein 2 n=1 Tax=Cajanus cajan TaxID=3821 RepID=A0A151QSZ3_CAJCA|nr:Heparanase-like protein 2 [Cajanus cajan]
MYVKVTLCYVVLLLFSLSSAKDAKIVVNGVTSIATTNNNFICATLDWWPANKCNYNDCPWGQTGILNLDLSNKVLSNAIKAFNPLRIRLGGSVEDQIVYQFGCPHFKKKESGLFGFSTTCLPKMRWDEVHNFFNKTELIFGLNALTGKKNSVEDKLNWVGNWNPKNAISLMKYTISKGYNIDSYELGNELCAAGIGARVDSVQYAKDITRLRRIVNLLYRDISRRPKVLGPGGFYGKEWFQSFLLNAGPGVVDGVTHHIYNLGAGVDKDIINKIQDPYYLSQVAETFKSVAQAVKEFTPWAAPWVGEAGGAYNSGSKDVSHTFVNGFWDSKRIKERIDCVLDDAPLGFEKMEKDGLKVESQDPPKEVNLGTIEKRRITYISKLAKESFKEQIVQVLHEYKDCFDWDYEEMAGLDRNLVEHRLSMILGKKPVKQNPRRFAQQVIKKIKEEGA